MERSALRFGARAHAIVRLRHGIISLLRIFVVVDCAADCGDCPLHPAAAQLLLALGDPVFLDRSAGLYRGGSDSGRGAAAEFVSGVSAAAADSGTASASSSTILRREITRNWGCYISTTETLHRPARLTTKPLLRERIRWTLSIGVAWPKLNSGTSPPPCLIWSAL